MIALLQRPLHMLVKAETLIAAAESERLAGGVRVADVRCFSRVTFNDLAEAAKRASKVVHSNSRTSRTNMDGIKPVTLVGSASSCDVLKQILDFG